MDWRDDVWQRFRKDLPGLVLIWVAVATIVIGLEVFGGGGRNPNLLATALGVLILGVAMTPLIWMRYEIPLIRGRDRAVRRAFAVIGVGCLWSVVALVVGVWLLAALGIE